MRARVSFLRENCAFCAWDPWVWACGELRLRGVLQAVERGACSVERAPHTKQKKDT